MADTTILVLKCRATVPLQIPAAGRSHGDALPNTTAMAFGLWHRIIMTNVLLRRSVFTMLQSISPTSCADWIAGGGSSFRSFHTLSSETAPDFQIPKDAGIAMQSKFVQEGNPGLVTTAVHGVALICAACVFRVRILIHCSAAVVLGQELFLDFPVALLGADAELEIFPSDRVPILDEGQ